jgi:Ca2+-transporting ATPase
LGKFNGFKGDYVGLTEEQVRNSQEKHGKNELVIEKKNTFLGKAIGVLKEPMFLLLFFTAMIYFLLGEPRDGIIMLVFVSFMSGINLFQEWRTDKTLQALKDLSSPRVTVIRNSCVEEIDSKELTVLDLVIIEEGEKIAADGEVIEVLGFGVDESTLTGESEVVWKKIDLTEEEKESHWRKNFCYAGTMATQGSALMRVASVGLNTEYGKIGVDIASVPQAPTPLEKQTKHLIKVCAFIGIGMFVLVFLITLQHTKSITTSILSGITLAMAMIPEEFPVILTVFLAMGAWRLAKKNSLIRRMPSVETLGAVSVLCVDKTGTLTQNKMTVQETFQLSKFSEKEMMYWAGLGCETEPYDPMEKAILEYVKLKDISKEELFKNELIHDYPFTSEIKMMGHVWKINDSLSLASKGSPESILPLCNLNHNERVIIETQQEALAKKGYRVIAVARNIEIKEVPENIKENKLELMGLIGLVDPHREEVPEAIKLCNKAGIRIVMITGDNGTTATSIAKKIGIPNSDNVITGQELEIMSEEELEKRVKNTNIFARVIPRHKMRIVKALKNIGEIVAMTGDGVNDAPALKYADIGIAMGKRGTAVAKEAADMILLDDNFTTIIDTVKDGRRIYDNIKKAVGYVFVIHIPIALIALITPLLHLPLLLLPIHVVLLELIIDPTCSIVFERQPEEVDIMERQPRKPGEALITSKLMIKAILQGLSIFAGAFGSYAYFFNSGYGESMARTFSLAVIIFANLFLVYVNQSENTFAISSFFKTKDKVLWYINIGILLGLTLVIYSSFGNELAKTLPLTGVQLFGSFAIAAVVTLWWEFVKLYKKLSEQKL